MRTSKQENAARWGVVASLVLHAFVVGPALLFGTKPVKPPPEQHVDVQILTPREYEAAAGLGEATETAPQAALPPASPERFAAAPAALAMAIPVKPAPPQSHAMIRPTSMLSEKTLADPRSREARAALATFAGSEQIEQLCGIEAMAQIHAWRAAFKPDRIVTYAMAGTKLAGETLVAEGAAFRSERKWYNLKFRCGLSRDHGRVVAFEFRVEDAVPEAEWQSHNLPPSETPPRPADAAAGYPGLSGRVAVRKSERTHSANSPFLMPLDSAQSSRPESTKAERPSLHPAE